MKLRKKIWIMLGLPLATQLLFVAVLSWNLNQLDVAATREVKAKKVIACCLELRNTLLKYVLSIYTGRFLSLSVAEISFKAMSDKLEHDKLQLKQLLADDGEAMKLFEQYDVATSRYLQTANDMEVTVQEGLGKMITYSRYLTDREVLEEMAFNVQKGMKSELLITARYAPIVTEFQPRQVARRRDISTLIIYGTLANTALVIFLGWNAGRTIVRRLSRLLKNIEAFTTLSQTRSLEGSDEFAEIDRKFRTVAEERNRSDEMRRSMYAMVSHDLRSPLTSLRLSLQLILAKHAEVFQESVRQKFTRIDNEIQRLCRLSNTFLDLERIEEGKLELSMQEVSVENLITESISAVRGLLESKKLRLESEIFEVQVIYCDGDRVIQVIVNLLSNSVKFSPNGAVLTIRVREHEGNFRFEICDQGPGIPEEKRKLLFGRFSQLEQPEEIRKSGSGLGLYICRMLVESHRGRIGVTCPPEGGSIFWFELPPKPKM